MIYSNESFIFPVNNEYSSSLYTNSSLLASISPNIENKLPFVHANQTYNYDLITYVRIRRTISWLSMIIVLIGLIGNFFSFVVLINPKMKTTTNIFLSNLCISSFIALLGLLINSVIYEIAYYYNITELYDFIIKIYPYVYPIINTFQMACIMLTVCVSVNQFLCIYFSKAKSYSKMSAQAEYNKSKKIVLTVYLVSIIYCIPYWLKFKFTEKNGLQQTELGKSRNFNRIVHFWLYLPIVYIIPLSILIFTNAYLFFKLMIAKQRRLRLSVMSRNFQGTQDHNTQASISSGVTRKRQSRESTKTRTRRSEDPSQNRRELYQMVSLNTSNQLEMPLIINEISKANHSDNGPRLIENDKMFLSSGIMSISFENNNDISSIMDQNSRCSNALVIVSNHKNNNLSIVSNEIGYQNLKHPNRESSCSNNVNNFKYSYTDNQSRFSRMSRRSCKSNGNFSNKLGRTKVTCMLIAVVIFFFICQFPNLIIHILQSMHCHLEMEMEHSPKCYSSSLYSYGIIISKFLLKINLSFNFACYCLFSDKFREVLNETVFRRKSTFN